MGEWAWKCDDGMTVEEARESNGFKTAKSRNKLRLEVVHEIMYTVIIAAFGLVLLLRSGVLYTSIGARMLLSR